MQIFRLSRHHLAEGVEFPEKNAGPWVLRPLFGGGVAWLDCDPMVVILNRVSFAILPHSLK
jgi:hypothetical protein